MFKRIFVVIFLFISSAHQIWGSSGNTPADAAKKALEEKLKKLRAQYVQSITQAEHQKVDASHMHKLIPIVPWNENLIWKNTEKTHVLMVSWMPKWAMEKFYQPNLGKQISAPPLANAMWVTAAPQIKEFAQTYQATTELTLTDRLNQKLGLPPSADDKYFVQSWVRPEDLFRPCLDSEIIDDECVFDLDTKDLPQGFKDITKFICIKPEYLQWFNERKKMIYQGNSAFPWTRLGYTLDWGDSNNPVGFSEFVVKPGSQIEIYSITPTEEYAQNPGDVILTPSAGTTSK